MISKKFLKFLIVGGVSALVNILSRVFFSLFTGFFIAISMAFFVALATAFSLNKFLVFEESIHKNWIIEYWYFFLVNIIGLIQTIVISHLLIYYLFPHVNFNFYPELTGHSVGVVVPVFTSFIGHKYFSFRGESFENQ